MRGSDIAGKFCPHCTPPQPYLVYTSHKDVHGYCRRVIKT